MTVNGGFPAPGPQDRQQPQDRSYAGLPPSAPPPTGPPVHQWAPMQPQIQMLTAHKPGIVPLRPLLLGDILDGAVKAVRFNPRSMVGLSALVLAAFLVPSAALGVLATRVAADILGRQGPEAEAFIGFPATLIQAISTGLATVLLSGLLIHVVGQAVLGRKPDMGQTWRSTRGRLVSLVAVSLLTGLVTLIASALLVGPGVLLLANDNLGSGLVLLLLGLLAVIAASLTISTKTSMAGPAIVLEGHGIGGGLRRSFALTRGAAFWRVLGITLVAAILAGIAGSLLGLPFSIAAVGIAAMSGQDIAGGQVIVNFVSHFSALLSGAITTPFVAAVTGLLYIDRRMRLEALDVVLLREAQTNPAPRI